MKKCGNFRLLLLSSSLINMTVAYIPWMFVQVQPCLRGACRIGHQMDNIISALIAVALRNRSSFQWRYLHIKKQGGSRNSNGASEIFRLEQYSILPPANWTGRYHVNSLSAKVPGKDPASSASATNERWMGHVSVRRVLDVLIGAERKCDKQWRLGKRPACILELQYAWRISLARTFYWALEQMQERTQQISPVVIKEDQSTEYKKSEQALVNVAPLVRIELLHLYCARMARVPAVRGILFSALSSSGGGKDQPFHIAVHARRGDRVHPDAAVAADGLEWVLQTGGDVQSSKKSESCCSVLFA